MYEEQIMENSEEPVTKTIAETENYLAWRADEPDNETTYHLETLFETKSLKNKVMYDDLHNRLIILGKMLNKFVQSVEKEHMSVK